MRARTLDEAYRIACQAVVDGERVAGTLETRNFTVELQDPTALSISAAGRRFNEDYAFLEFLWYLSRDRRPALVEGVARIWGEIKSHGVVQSNYGVDIMPWLEWVRDELTSDANSRKCCILIGRNEHKLSNYKDVPCTQSITFYCRPNKEGELLLHCSVCMRSNDVVFGFCNDVYCFCLFQQLLCNELNDSGFSVGLGGYHHYATSLHCYDRHEERVRSAAADASAFAGKKTVLSISMPDAWSYRPEIKETRELQLEYAAEMKEASTR